MHIFVYIIYVIIYICCRIELVIVGAVHQNWAFLWILFYRKKENRVLKMKTQSVSAAWTQVWVISFSFLPSFSSPTPHQLKDGYFGNLETNLFIFSASLFSYIALFLLITEKWIWYIATFHSSVVKPLKRKMKCENGSLL